MFKFLTLAFLGAVTCFSQEDSIELKKKSSGAGLELKSYKDAKKKYEAYEKANNAYLKEQGKADKLKAAMGVANKKYAALKKASDALAKAEKKQAAAAKKSKGSKPSGFYCHTSYMLP